MKILITGSRQMSPAMLKKAIEVVAWCKTEGHTILVGDTPGVDRAVRQSAVNRVPIEVYGAHGTIRDEHIGSAWEKRVLTHGSYSRRDEIMARDCDWCVAIWNGSSRGTKITMDAAKRFGKRVILRRFDIGTASVSSRKEASDV